MELRIRDKYLSERANVSAFPDEETLPELDQLLLGMAQKVDETLKQKEEGEEKKRKLQLIAIYFIN